MRSKALPLAIAISVFSSPYVVAGAPTFSDARALAMGGVGVTAARPAAAGFFNPALLAVKQPDKRDGFGMILPSLTAIAHDEEELRDVADNFEDDFITPFESAINTLEANIGGPNQAAAQANLAEKTRALNNELQSIDKDQARVDLGLGFSALIPSQTFGAGLFVSGSARVAGQVNYNDQQTLDDLENLLTTSTISTIDEVYSFYDLTNDAEQLQSSVRAVGSAYSQVGVAMSHNFRFGGHDYALGVSPKMVDLRAYDFIASVDNAEVDDLKDTKVSESKFNLDLGVASFVDARERILVGMSIINVLPQEITTKPGFDTTNLAPGTPLPEGIKIELKPTVTAGVSYRGDSYEIATDLELTKTEEFFGEGYTQYWGLGAEYDLFETFQVRGGMRYNIAESEGVVFTAGFGLRVVGVTFELAALSDTDSNNVGVGTQFGVTF